MMKRKILCSFLLIQQSAYMVAAKLVMVVVDHICGDAGVDVLFSFLIALSIGSFGLNASAQRGVTIVSGRMHMLSVVLFGICISLLVVWVLTQMFFVLFSGAVADIRISPVWFCSALLSTPIPMAFSRLIASAAAGDW